jgi:hypothetical protein
MEGLQNFLAPLVSLWAVHNAIFYSAGFVNRMREMVISGIDGNARLSTRHRKAVFIDWILCMAATILVSLLFGGILIGVSWTMPQLASVRWALVLVAAYPIVCSALFIVCSVMDVKLMRQALADAERVDRGNSQVSAP